MSCLENFLIGISKSKFEMIKEHNNKFTLTRMIFLLWSSNKFYLQYQPLLQTAIVISCMK